MEVDGFQQALEEKFQYIATQEELLATEMARAKEAEPRAKASIPRDRCS